VPLLAVALVAALVRVWVALDATDAPFWSVPIVDEIAYMQMSERMVLGQDPPYGAYYMTPGYAWFLAALVGLGAQLPAVKIVQLGLGVLNAVLVFALGRRWFDTRVGVVAGLLWAVAPTVLLHEILILKPTLTVFLALAALWIVARDGAGVVAWTLGGLLLGAAATVRGEMLVVGLGLVVGALIAARREFPPAPRPGWAPVLGLLALLAVVAVPTAQNLARGGGFVVIAYSGGPNFYIGNHDGADGSYLPLRPGRSDATVEEDDAVRLAREESPLALDAAGVSRFWWRQGLDWWAREPLDAMSLTLKKAVLLWGAWEGNDVHSLPIAGRWIAALDNPVVRPWLIFPLALAGLVFLRPWRGRWPLVVFLLGSWIALVPFFVFERFRLPMMAVATVLAAAAVIRGLDAWRAGHRQVVAAAALATVAVGGLLALPSVPRDESALHVNVGSMLLQQSRWEEALREFDAVRQESPGAKRVEINRATALDRLGRSDEAMRALETALRALYAEARGTGRPPVEELTYCHELAGDIERRRGRFEAAVQQYEAALRLAPGHPRVRQKLGALREGP
jgi:hypothetical protein